MFIFFFAVLDLPRGQLIFDTRLLTGLWELEVVPGVNTNAEPHETG